jgi:hypothetical protein
MLLIPVWFLDAIKRRNFLAGLLASPLLHWVRFSKQENEKCGEKVFEGLRPGVSALPDKYLAVRCSLPRNHKGPHVWLNPG